MHYFWPSKMAFLSKEILIFKFCSKKSLHQLWKPLHFIVCIILTAILNYEYTPPGSSIVDGPGSGTPKIWPVPNRCSRCKNEIGTSKRNEKLEQHSTTSARRNCHRNIDFIQESSIHIIYTVIIHDCSTKPNFTISCRKKTFSASRY